MAYLSENRSIVMKFLTRNVGFDTATKMWTSKTIPPELLEKIETCVISSRVKPIPELDFSSVEVKEDAVRYLIRLYGEEDGMRRFLSRDFTEFDKKMIHTMGMLRTKYKTCSTNRSHTRQTTKQQLPEFTSTTKKDLPLLCKAYKMNGEKCTAKTKNNTLYCARHSKKCN